MSFSFVFFCLSRETNYFLSLTDFSTRTHCFEREIVVAFTRANDVFCTSTPKAFTNGENRRGGCISVCFDRSFTTSAHGISGYPIVF